MAPLRATALATLAFLALALPTAASALPTSGEFSDVSIARNGKVRVTAAATIEHCEKRRTPEQEAAGLPASPCGGHLVLVVRPRTLHRDHGVVSPAVCRPRLFGDPELWNREGVEQWVMGVVLRGELASAPPERVVWRGSSLVFGGLQPPLRAGFEVRFGLWPGGAVDTPCLYLAYASRQFEGAPLSYWTLAQVEIPTPYPRCKSAERAHERAVARWYRLLRKTEGKPKAWRRAERQRREVRRQMNRALRQLERSCPRLDL